MARKINRKLHLIAKSRHTTFQPLNLSIGGVIRFDSTSKGMIVQRFKRLTDQNTYNLNNKLLAILI